DLLDRPGTAVGDVPLLDGAERTRMIEQWNDTSVPLPARTLPDLVDEAVAGHARSTALVFADDQLTYAEFDARINRLARYLIGVGVGAETIVGLAIPRSVELLVAMYAITKAGGAYLPIDPEHPAERNEYVLDSARPPFVLTTAEAAPKLPGSAEC